MAEYTQRVQTVLTADQYEQLRELAKKSHKPVSVLIREAIEQTYFAEIERRAHQDALARLLALEAPVADWPQMEDEIEQGAMDAPAEVVQIPEPVFL